MNVWSNFFSVRTSACALLLALGSLSATHASSATYELGRPFPKTLNHSLNPQWRVYVFELEGIRYFQINDIFGGIHVIFAEVEGDILVIPIGLDTSNVERLTAAIGNDMTQCGACSGGIVLGSASANDGPISDAGHPIYQDTTLQIRMDENAAHEPIWRIITQPSRLPLPQKSTP